MQNWKSLLYASAVFAIAASPAQGQSLNDRKLFDIPPQSMSEALIGFSRQSGWQIVTASADIGSIRSRRVSGRMTSRQAIERLLAGSGLRWRDVGDGSIAVGAAGNSQAGTAAADNGEAPDEMAGVAEILVVGSRSQNVDIRRTEDDPQPYVVIDRKKIERAAVTNVEDLLRTQLPMTSGSLTNGLTGSGTSGLVNLRGLGLDQTLILIDGRRVPGVATSGRELQPDLNGIPLAAIERVEILPNTASGIYGGSATGGVINIILRRDYSGGEMQLTYGNSYEGGGATRRADFSYGHAFNGGATNVMLTASIAKTDPLYYQDRDLFERGIALRLQNNPAGLLNVSTPPLGATTNIRSTNGSNLVLLPAYGGTALGSAITFVPDGFSGGALQLGQGLAANAGRYNFALADTAQAGGGGRRSLTSGTTLKSIDLNVKHSFNPSLETFLTIAASQNEGRYRASFASGTFTLLAGNPGNPFAQNITVTVPLVGTDRINYSDVKTFRATGGLTFDLPLKWRGVVDGSWGITDGFSRAGSNIQTAVVQPLIRAGTINIFADPDGLDFSSYLFPDGTNGPVTNKFWSASARFSGPLPFLRMPGGAPQLTLLGEHRNSAISTFVVTSPSFASVSTNYPRSQHTSAAYAELVVPLIAPRNGVPLIHSLEVQAAARYERYGITGSNYSDTSLPAARVDTHRSLSYTSPTIAMKYEPVAGIAFRASYARGFLPPHTGQLSPAEPSDFPAFLIPIFGLTDPQRGNEALGAGNDIVLLGGGSPSLRPETSKSLSAGVIVTPTFLTGFRFSADWTRIKKRDNITNAIDPTTQQGILELLAYFPERVTRSTNPALLNGYAVGPVIQIDTSLVNIAKFDVEAWDFSAAQEIDLGSAGGLELGARATLTKSVRSQATPAAPVLEFARVNSNPRWRGIGTVRWNIGQASLQWTTSYTSKYYMLINRSFSIDQGSAQIRSQMIHDLSFSYKIDKEHGPLSGLEVVVNAKNFLNKRPAIDVVTARPLYYSGWGGPLRGYYTISLRKSF